MNIIAVIQADMASPSLPCKEMLSLRGLPVIDWAVHRISKSNLVTDIAVAAPASETNDALRHHLENQGIAVHENEPGNIFGLLEIAENENADALVLIGADSPFAWGAEIDKLIRFHAESENPGLTYAYNHIPANNAWPAGLGGEIIPTSALKALAAEAIRQENRDSGPASLFSHVQSCPTVTMTTFDPADQRLRNPSVDLRLNAPSDYRKLALMLVHPDMHPAEILQRYPRYKTP